MKPDISEFSYGFALTHELITHYHFASAAPEFPNLRNEGHLGYDVRLAGATPVFLQFKLSDVLTRSTARAAVSLGVPHYRAALRPKRHSQQHALLLSLERRGYAVYYAAPMFHMTKDLDHAFRHKNVTACTAFFRPSDIGPLPDDDDHSLAFTQRSTTAWFYSEPKQLFRLDGINLVREWIPSLKRRGDAEAAASVGTQDLVSALLSLLAEFGTDAAPLPLPEPTTRLQQASLIARFYFGAELLFA